MFISKNRKISQLVIEEKTNGPLTEEEKESNKNQELCHICEKEFCRDNNKEMTKSYGSLSLYREI